MTMFRPVSTQERADPIDHESACISCGYLVTEELDDHERLCSECRAPLRFLAFPEEYCDLGAGD